MNDQVETTQTVNEVPVSETPEITSTEATESTGEKQTLNINDLAQVKVIIDVAASRGAFKPAEMTIVGETYNKISSFLEAATKGN